MKKCFSFILLILIAFLSACSTEKQFSLQSPNEKYQFELEITEEQNELFYEVQFDGELVIAPSQLGFEFSDSTQVSQPTAIEDTQKKSVDENWKPVYGEKSQYRDKYNEALLSFNNDAFPYKLRIRAYDEGVAFRYEFIDAYEGKVIVKENTQFNFSTDTKAWVSERAQSEIYQTKISNIAKLVDRPLLLEYHDSLFAAIGEANLIDFARMKLRNPEPGTAVLEAALGGEVSISSTLHSPWRFIMAAKSPAKILENNYLLLNLSEPNKIEDTSWIRPGKVLREVTLTTQGGLAAVDFAVKHNLQFVEFDAGWYGHEYDEASDATTVTVDPKRSPGPLDLQQVIDYGKEKGIGVILYVNRRALENQLDEVLPLAKSWGVAGLKYGFVNVGSQYWTEWLHEAVRKAADHQLMVDIHDEYRPTGFSRTYPNLMTQEGIRGDEERPSNDMAIKTIFTRMIAGAGDHTNCYFNARVTENMGSHVGQMAKTICIYSPWQFIFWYDRPEGSPRRKGGAGNSEGIIQEIPDLRFYDQVPTVWDDTRVIDGYPGRLAIIARKRQDTWFLGVLTGTEAHQLHLKLDFLEADTEFEAEIYEYDEALNSLTKVKISRGKVNSESILSKEVPKQNGLAVIFKAIDA